MENEINILQSKRKLMYLITYNFALILISILMIIFSGLLYFNILIIFSRIFAGVFILVFGYNLINLLKQIKKPKKLLVITNEGIIDNSGFAIFKNIKWDEIQEINIINKEYTTKNEIINKTYIGINLKNIEDIFSITDEYIKDMINENIKNFENHIIINLENADCDIKSTAEILKEKFNNFTK